MPRRPKNTFRDLGQKLLIPPDAEIAQQHLTGRMVAGIYPSLPDDTYWFLAVRLALDTGAGTQDACTERRRSQGAGESITKFFRLRGLHNHQARRRDHWILGGHLQHVCE